MKLWSLDLRQIIGIGIKELAGTRKANLTVYFSGARDEIITNYVNELVIESPYKWAADTTSFSKDRCHKRANTY